jgi:hypothetical protein
MRQKEGRVVLRTDPEMYRQERAQAKRVRISPVPEGGVTLVGPESRASGPTEFFSGFEPNGILPCWVLDLLGITDSLFLPNSFEMGMFILCLSHHCILTAGSSFARFVDKQPVIASLVRHG